MLIKSEIVKTKTSEIWMDAYGVLRVNVLEGAEMDLKEVKICFNVYRELGCDENNKTLQLISSKVNFDMTKEAREYVAQQGKNYFIASAVVTDNLAVRLLANFFSNFYKRDVVPFKIFDTEDKAFDWLVKFRK